MKSPPHNPPSNPPLVPSSPYLPPPKLPTLIEVILLSQFQASAIQELGAVWGMKIEEY